MGRNVRSFTTRGCRFVISIDGRDHSVSYVGWMGMHYVGSAGSWEEAKDLAREYAATRV